MKRLLILLSLLFAVGASGCREDSTKDKLQDIGIRFNIDQNKRQQEQIDRLVWEDCADGIVTIYGERDSTTAPGFGYKYQETQDGRTFTVFIDGDKLIDVHDSFLWEGLKFEFEEYLVPLTSSKWYRTVLPDDRPVPTHAEAWEIRCMALKKGRRASYELHLCPYCGKELK